MDKLAVALWGCFFGTAVLMLAGSVLAYLKSLRRIALNAALAALLSGLFVMAFLGGHPYGDDPLLPRYLACLTAASAAVLLYLLLSVLGAVKSPRQRTVSIALLAAMAIAVGCGGWLLAPAQALALSLGAALLLSLLGLAACVRSGLRGDRLAWSASWGLLCLTVALVALGQMALSQGPVPQQVQVVGALAATLYLGTMAAVLWARYSYLIELHHVIAHGPAYDPITRMRSQAETGNVLEALFDKARGDKAPIGIIVLTIVNFYSLEKLQGQAALNHALFVSAGRLRRALPSHIDIGRLGQGGFVLAMRNCKDSGELVVLARLMARRLSRPLQLKTSTDAAQLEGRTTLWAAELGVGVLVASDPSMTASSAVAIARAMSRTALSYSSRVAWYDHASGEMVEMPVLAPG